MPLGRHFVRGKSAVTSHLRSHASYRWRFSPLDLDISRGPHFLFFTLTFNFWKKARPNTIYEIRTYLKTHSHRRCIEKSENLTFLAHIELERSALCGENGSQKTYVA